MKHLTYTTLRTGLSALALAGVFAVTTVAGAQETPKTNPFGPLVRTPVKTTTNPPKSNEDATPQERLEFLLSGYEFFPAKDDLAKLGTDAEVASMLRTLASDTKARPMLRLRSVDALAYYTDAETVTFLDALLKAPIVESDDVYERANQDRMRHRAIMSLAKSQKEQSLGALEAMLISEDIQLRMTAISAIAKHAGSEGKARLKEFAQSEKHPVVRRELRKYMKL